MRTFLFFVTVAWTILSLASHSPAEETIRPAWSRVEQIVGEGGLVKWATSSPAVVFDVSAVDLHHHLSGVAEAQRVSFTGRDLRLKLGLARQGEDAVVKETRVARQFMWTSAEGSPQDKSPGRFVTDLHGIFGPLSTGKYSVQVWLHADSLTLDGARIAEASWIAGPTVELAVVRFDAKPWQADDPSEVTLDLQLCGWATAESQRYVRAKVTNNGLHPIEIEGYVNRRRVAPADFLLCPLGHQVLLPSQGWLYVRNGICGTGLGPVVIPPGKSQNVSIWAIGTDDFHNGVYRFGLSYTVRETYALPGMERSKRRYVHSTPFLVTSEGSRRLDGVVSSE